MGYQLLAPSPALFPFPPPSGLQHWRGTLRTKEWVWELRPATSLCSDSKGELLSCLASQIGKSLNPTGVWIL